MADVAASVLARLKNKAAKSGRSAAEPTFVPFGAGEKDIRITVNGRANL